MPHQSTPKSHRRFARAMRSDATRAEAMLWQAVRGRKLDGMKFRRQVPLDGYILDFLCLEHRLIIEVDGGQHSESKSDEVRDAHFMDQGFRIMRLWNNEVEDNLDSICLHILSLRIEALLPLSCKNI